MESVDRPLTGRAERFVHSGAGQPEIVEVEAIEVSGPQEPVDHTSAEESHIHLSPQSIWPISTAAGIALAGMGLVTLPAVSFLGLALMVLSIVYWIQELRHEPHEPH